MAPEIEKPHLNSRTSARRTARAEVHPLLALHLNAVPVALVLVEVGSGRILFANERSRVLKCGIASEIDADCHIDGYMNTAFDVQGYPMALEELPRFRVARGEKLRGFEMILVTAEGRVPVVVHSGLLPRQDGQFQVAILSFQEIAKMKQTETELEKKTQALLAANAELQRFAAVAAHDLKSPLNAIIGFSELLEDEINLLPDASVEAHEYVELIHGASQRMSRLIGSLLEYARSGVMDKTQFASIPLSEVMRIVRLNLKTEIDKSHANIRTDEHAAVWGDEIQLIQLFQNLVANAIKYRRVGVHPEITITSHDLNGKWLIQIHDNGVGIPQDQQSHIFEIFGRVQATAHHEGAGIGLAVVKRIVENHEGTIWLESEVGKGTTFFITLPAAPEQLSLLDLVDDSST